MTAKLREITEHVTLRAHTHTMWVRVLGAALLIASIFLIAMSQQETPPTPSAPKPLNLPKPVEMTLANGLRVIVIERTEGAPLVTSRLVIKSGGEVDPPQLAGLANMTASLLTEGTTTRSAPQVAQAVEELGGSLDSNSTWDGSMAEVNVMSANIEPAMTILADIVRRPAFKDEEIERQRQQLTDELRVDLSEPGTIAGAAAVRLLYGDAPYGHILRGTPESLARIKRNDITTLHSTYYRPDNAILVIGGNIKAALAFKLAQKFFGDWRKPSNALPLAALTKNEALVTNRPGILVIDKPDAGQAGVVLIRSGLRRSDPDYFRGIVTNSVLSGFSGRLNQEIRIKRGLSYGARSTLDVRREVGPYVASAQTKNQSGPEVASLLMGELGRLSTESVSDVELAPRKAVLVGNFGRSLETNADLVAQISKLALLGLNLDEINKYTAQVQLVNASDVRKFAGTKLNSSGASIVIVGDAKQFIADLRKQFQNVEVIPESELDLNSATLRRKTTGSQK